MKLMDRLFTKARGQIGYGLFVKSRKLNVAQFNALLDERIVAWCDGSRAIREARTRSNRRLFVINAGSVTSVPFDALIGTLRSSTPADPVWLMYLSIASASVIDDMVSPDSFIDIAVNLRRGIPGFNLYKSFLEDLERAVLRLDPEADIEHDL